MLLPQGLYAITLLPMIQNSIAQYRRHAVSAFPLLLSTALALAGCQQADRNALASSDAAFKGQNVDGQVQPVISRAVIVGTGGAQIAACAAMMQPKDGKVTVRWSNSKAGPVKAEFGSALFACEGMEGWTGVVFPSVGQDIDECLVSNPTRAPHEYQGPCRWGWVETNDLGPVAS